MKTMFGLTEIQMQQVATYVAKCNFEEKWMCDVENMLMGDFDDIQREIIKEHGLLEDVMSVPDYEEWMWQHDCDNDDMFENEIEELSEELSVALAEWEDEQC